MSNGGILSGPMDLDGKKRRGPDYPIVDGVVGLDVVDIPSNERGRIIEIGADFVKLELPSGGKRQYHLHSGGFRVDDIQCTLRKPPPKPQVAAPTRTASGSVAPADTRARVARGSRLWVEGVHDAELIEKVWGDDLRAEGIVVEPIGGLDDLVALVDEFSPQPDRRLGVLVDHFVEGAKEERIARAAARPDLMVAGHPYVDVWEAVKPSAVGIAAWPQIPMGTPWKEGICAALGVDQPPTFWKQVLGSVDDWTDVETPLVNAVERLLDFVTEG